MVILLYFLINFGILWFKRGLNCGVLLEICKNYIAFCVIYNHQETMIVIGRSVDSHVSICN